MSFRKRNKVISSFYDNSLTQPRRSVDLRSISVLALSGSADEPSYAFVGEPYIGMFLSGSGQLAFAVSGSVPVMLSSSGQVYFYGDTIYNSDLTVSGALGVTGQSSLMGNVGIGTDSPTHMLHLKSTDSAGILLQADSDNDGGEVGSPYVLMTRDGSATVGGILGEVQVAGESPLESAYTGTTSNSTFLGNNYAGALHLGTNTNVRMTIDSDGYVGVGTSYPKSTLQLVSSTATPTPNCMLALTGSAGASNYGRDDIKIYNYSPGIRFVDRSASSDNFRIGVQSDKFSISIDNDGDESQQFTTDGNYDDVPSALVLDSAGNVGIGTASPSQKLQVVGEVQVGDTTSVFTPGIRLRDASATANYRLGVDQGKFNLSVDSDNDDATDGNGHYDDLPNALVLDSAGNVGIGTDSPGVLLHLNSSSPKIQLTDTTTNADCFINADTSAGSLIVAADQSNEVAGSVLRFDVDGAAKMTIKDTGNVGIGTTDPQELLHLATNGAGPTFALEDTAATTAYLRFAASDGANYIQSGLVRSAASAADLHFTDIFASNTWMTIQDDGKIGIGTSAPGTLLDMEGASAELNINATTGTGKIQFQEAGGDRWSIDQDTVNKLHLSWQSANKVTFDGTGGSGKVGIGTSSPTELLHLVANNDAENTSILIENTDQRLELASYYELGVIQYASIQSKNDAGTGQKLILNLDGGFVGIGTNSPTARLEIQTTATEGGQAVSIDQNDADKPFIDFQGTTGANATSTISTYTAGNSIQGFIQIEINGAKRWIPYYDDPTS